MRKYRKEFMTAVQKYLVQLNILYIKVWKYFGIFYEICFPDLWLQNSNLLLIIFSEGVDYTIIK